MLQVKDRYFIIPGQIIGNRIPVCENCFKEGNGVFSSVLGMIRIGKNRIRVIPSSGTYTPQEGDVVMGVIMEVTKGGWIVDINSPYTSRMNGEEAVGNPINEDLRKYFDVGDIISAKIISVNEVKASSLIKPWKLSGGVVVDVNPRRIARVVGRGGSMLSILKKKTRCSIIVGQNGRVWIKRGNMSLAIEAIKIIEREAQTQGLTDRISMFLEKKADSRGD